MPTPAEINSVNGDSLFQDKSNTTVWVTRVLLLTFVFAVVGLFVVGIANYKDGNTDAPSQENYKQWFDLLKNSLVLVGTTLTTIIGYYFGQRESRAAYEKAYTAEQEVKTEKERTQTAADAVEKLQQKVDDLLTTDPVGGSDDEFDPTRAMAPTAKRKT
jgi:hypothetical protein